MGPIYHIEIYKTSNNLLLLLQMPSANASEGMKMAAENHATTPTVSPAMRKRSKAQRHTSTLAELFLSPSKHEWFDLVCAMRRMDFELQKAILRSSILGNRAAQSRQVLHARLHTSGDR
jgi:hypothetical protein